MAMSPPAGATFAEIISPKRFFAGGAWLVVLRLLTAVALLVLNALLTSSLTVSEVGVYLFLYSITIIGGVLTNLGTNTAGVRFISQARGTSDGPLAESVAVRGANISLINSVVLVSGALALWLLVDRDAMAQIPGLAEFGPYVFVWIAATAVRMSAADTLIAQDRILAAGVFSGFLSAAITAVTVTFFVAAGSLELTTVVQTATASSVFTAVLARSIALRNFARGHDVTGIPSVRSFFGVGVPAVLSGALSSQRKEILVAVAGVAVASETSALIGLSNQIVQVIALPVVALTSMIRPLIARSAAEAAGGLRSNINRVRTLWTIALLPVCLLSVFAVILAEPLGGVVFGPAYSGLTTVLLIAVIGRLISVVAGPTSQTLIMTGNERSVLWLSLLEIIPLIVLGTILSRSHGAAGASTAYAATVLFSAMTYTTVIRLRLQVWVFAWIFPSSLRSPATSMADQGA